MVALFQKVFGEGGKVTQSSSSSSIVMWPYMFRLFFSPLFCLPAKILKHPLAKRPPPTSFSPVTSTNVRFGPKNFLTFSFNPFATLVQNFKFVPSASPK